MEEVHKNPKLKPINRRKFIERSGLAASAAVLGNIETRFDEKSSKSESAGGTTASIKLGLYSISYGGVW